MEPILGMIILFGGNFAPRGWAFCDGTLLRIPSNTALFALLGTIYGGDGRTTFALPDLRGRVPVHFGGGPGLTNSALGKRAGREAITLEAENLPAHSHTLNAADDNNVSTRSRGAMLGTAAIYGTDSTTTVSLGPDSISTVGRNVPINIRQPMLAMNYIIAINGIFPSRD